MRTCLVTGGAGFIGSNFINYILKKHKNIYVINIDKLSYAANLANLKSVEKSNRYEFIHGDICDKEKVEYIFKTNDINYVVNFAAESHVDRSIENPLIFVKSNINGTVNLLDISKKYWEAEDNFKKYIQISTDEVYGSLGSEGFFTENTALDPHSPYSASKASADLMVKAYYDTYNMPVNITRCSNNYGPYQHLEKLIPLIVNNCLNKKSIPIYGDGMNVRDWLYVEDHCQAIYMVLEKGVVGRVYNIGGHNEKTNICIAKIIIDYINKNIDSTVDEGLIKYVEDRKGHDRRYAINPAKIKNEIGWFPKTSFEVGIKSTINWYVNNERWLNG